MRMKTTSPPPGKTDGISLVRVTVYADADLCVLSGRGRRIHPDTTFCLRT